MSKVAVAVVSWNTRDLLAECLASLAPEHRDDRAEVWVVDNASVDGSADLVREQYGWANLVVSNENLGFGRAVNLVANQTESEWIAPANADIRLMPGALECLLAIGQSDPSSGALAPRLLAPDGSTQQSVFPFPTLPFTLLHNLGALRVSRRSARRWPLPANWDPDRCDYVPWAVGAFLPVRRAAWDEIGGFDERQWMYAEDLDLGWRLKQAGWRTIYVPDAVVHHEESAAVSTAWGDERHLRWHRSTYAWLLRRRGVAVTRTIALINVVGYSVRAALLAPLAVCAPRRWGGRRRSALHAARAHRTGFESRSVLEAVR